MRPKQMARMAVFYMLESVMDVLMRHQNKGGITPAKIGAELGLSTRRIAKAGLAAVEAKGI